MRQVDRQVRKIVTRRDKTRRGAWSKRSEDRARPAGGVLSRVESKLDVVPGGLIINTASAVLSDQRQAAVL